MNDWASERDALLSLSSIRRAAVLGFALAIPLGTIGACIFWLKSPVTIGVGVLLAILLSLAPIMARFYSLGYGSGFRQRISKISEKAEFMRELKGTVRERLLLGFGSVLILGMTLVIDVYS